MNILFLILLAIVQGLTEFLPVSSSAHLILMPHIFGMPDQGYEIDIAVHFGSLFAVMIYFRREMGLLFRGLFNLFRLQTNTDEAQFFLKLSIATIPVVAFGLLLTVGDWIDNLRNPIIIAITMIFFGIVLYIADKRGAQEKQFEDWSWRDAIIMGLWQAVALIPGTSRSGATVTASRILGYKRHDGAKIAMLMSIPTILAGATLLALKIITADTPAQLGINATIAAIASFIAAYLALTLMMRLLRSVSYTPYVIYRIILGVVLLVIVIFYGKP